MRWSVEVTSPEGGEGGRGAPVEGGLRDEMVRRGKVEGKAKSEAEDIMTYVLRQRGDLIFWRDQLRAFWQAARKS